MLYFDLFSDKVIFSGIECDVSTLDLLYTDDLLLIRDKFYLGVIRIRDGV